MTAESRDRYHNENWVERRTKEENQRREPKRRTKEENQRREPKKRNQTKKNHPLVSREN